MITTPDPYAGRRCLIIAGLPGSGKTRYAQALGPEWAVIDDPDGPDDLPERIKGNVAITSPFFCRSEAMDDVFRVAQARWPGIVVEAVFFESDPAACARNAMRRPGKEVRGLIEALSRVYAPPADARPVWRPEGE